MGTQQFHPAERAHVRFPPPRNHKQQRTIGGAGNGGPAVVVFWLRRDGADPLDRRIRSRGVHVLGNLGRGGGRNGKRSLREKASAGEHSFSKIRQFSGPSQSRLRTPHRGRIYTRRGRFCTAPAGQPRRATVTL